MRIKMKQILLLVLAAMVFLTACSDSLEAAEFIEVNTSQDSPSYVEGEDFQQNWNSWGSCEADLTTMIETGYYFYDYYGSRMLYFHDFATNTTVPLCNLPNCEHNDQECNAYLSVLPTYLQYYDGNLYAISSDTSVYRISSDGATVGKVGGVLSINGGAFECVVHRGYVYCAVYTNAASKRTPEVYRLCLSGGEEAELVASFDPCFGGACYLNAYGNYVYIQVRHYEDEDGNGYNGDLYRYSIHTGETELVLDNLRRDFVVDAQYVYYDNDTQVAAYDLETGESTILLDVGCPVFLALDGNYLYCDNSPGTSISTDATLNGSRTVAVIDVSTRELVATIPLTIESDAQFDLIGIAQSDLITCLDFETFYRTDLNAALAGETAQWELMN